MDRNVKHIKVQIIGERVHRKPGEPDIIQTVSFREVASTRDLEARIHSWNKDNEIAIRSVKIVDDVSK